MNLVFLVVILISAAVIAVVVFRKLPQLANLDLASLNEEQQFQKKRQIIGKRIEEHNRRVKEIWSKRLAPFNRVWRVGQFKFRVYVGKVEKLWYHERVSKSENSPDAPPAEEKIQKISNLVAEGEQCLSNNNFSRAEELFIAAIKIDQKSASAYRGLGDTYLAQNSLEEARETYRFVLQLEPEDDSVLVKLAQIAESQGDVEEAIQYLQQATVVNDSLAPRFYHLAELLLKIKQPLVAKDSALQAVQLEGKNPKYLDLLVETAIICSDKPLARLYFNELRLVNPDNQKLDEMFQRIDKI
ncbi:MAG: tetratricopeptide repeat protein [Candidatus Magasanikbacteria bacterium]